MASNKRLEEKHQRILRQLQSLPENKQCADCPNRGPSYVNLFNYSFVCTRCSGLLRDFSHRVKSVSASSFSEEEIQRLQRGGNDVCRKIWLAKFQADRERIPTGADTYELKEFMRKKYIDKKWYNETAAAEAANSNNSVSVATSPTGNDASMFGSAIQSPVSVTSAPAATNRLRQRSLVDVDLFGTSNVPVTAPVQNQASSVDFFAAVASNGQHNSNPFGVQQPSSTDMFGTAQQARSNPFGVTAQPAVSNQPFGNRSPVDPFKQRTSVSNIAAGVSNNNLFAASSAPAAKSASTMGTPNSFAAQKTAPAEDRYAAFKELSSLSSTNVTSGNAFGASSNSINALPFAQINNTPALNPFGQGLSGADLFAPAAAPTNNPFASVPPFQSQVSTASFSSFQQAPATANSFGANPFQQPFPYQQQPQQAPFQQQASSYAFGAVQQPQQPTPFSQPFPAVQQQPAGQSPFAANPFGASSAPFQPRAQPAQENPFGASPFAPQQIASNPSPASQPAPQSQAFADLNPFAGFKF